MGTDFTNKRWFFKLKAHKDDPSYYTILPHDIVGLCNDIQADMTVFNEDKKNPN